MYRLSFELPEQEWLRIAAEARHTWPDERLSTAELLRRVRQSRHSHPAIPFARISEAIRCENLELVSGHPMLVNAAMDAVKQWQYKPNVLNGVPVEVRTTINVNFSLVENPQTTKPD